MRSVRNLPISTRRDAWVEVNLSALEQNIDAIQRHIPPGTSIMAVIKGDAYGHGATLVVPTLEAYGVALLGVASMDEALQLRQAKVTMPILVLGATPEWAMQDALKHDIQLTIFTERQLSALQQACAATGEPAHIHIKVDTGMHRVGVSWEAAIAFYQRCQLSPAVVVEGIFSHLADPADAAFTALQQARWQHVLTRLPQPWPTWVHLANSLGTWQYPVEPANLVRVGLSLFGYAGESGGQHPALKPLMGLKARVVHLHDLPPGDGVSYGQTYHNTTDSPQRVATLPLGYADGVPRGLSNQIDALYHGQRLPQVGTITMDQMMLNVTQAPGIQVGDVVTLIGPSENEAIWLDDWARKLNTIEYELMCGLRVRLPKTTMRE